MKFYFLIASIMLSFLLVGCRHSSVPENHLQTVTVKPTTFTKTLYFAGTIQPLTKTPVIAPIAGTVSKVFYQYGYPVKKGDRLCMLQSSKQLEVYQNALTEYLKAQQSLNTSKGKFESDKQLYAHDLISLELYHQSETGYEGDRLNYMQAKDKFESILKQYQLKQLPDLSLSNLKAIEQSFALKNKIREIPVMAPTSGIALYDKSAKGSIGNTAQEGDVIVYIGDLSGITVPIQVSEIHVDQLKLGQTAIITTLGSSPVELKGQVKNLDMQAVGEEALPTFPAIIEVPALSAADQATIHVGTNVTVAIPVHYTDEMVIPWNAVIQKNHEPYVRVLDPNTHLPREIKISTGETTEDSVVVTNGLDGGEELVISH